MMRPNRDKPDKLGLNLGDEFLCPAGFCWGGCSLSETFGSGNMNHSIHLKYDTVIWKFDEIWDHYQLNKNMYI